MKKSEMDKFLIHILIVVVGLPALIIFGFVDLSAKIDLGQVMKIIIFAVLVVVTTIYAERTSRIAETAREQANTSVKMAKEMRKQRYDTVRPLIDIQREPWDEDKMPEALDGKSGDTSRGLVCVLRNTGLGPAIDLYSFVQFFLGERQHYDFGTLATGEKTHKMNLSVKQEDGRMALLAY